MRVLCVRALGSKVRAVRVYVCAQALRDPRKGSSVWTIVSLVPVGSLRWTEELRLLSVFEG